MHLVAEGAPPRSEQRAIALVDVAPAPRRGARRHDPLEPEDPLLLSPPEPEPDPEDVEPSAFRSGILEMSSPVSKFLPLISFRTSSALDGPSYAHTARFRISSFGSVEPS